MSIRRSSGKKKVSTNASQKPIIVYERKGNQEKNSSPSKKNEKKKHKENEFSTSYIPRNPFPATLEAKTPCPFTKKGVRMDEMMELFKQIQIKLPLLDAIKQVPS